MDGTKAVRLARDAIISETTGVPMNAFEESGPSGAFVTIRKFPSGDLRGCIGYPEPVFPMNEAIVRSARSACHDPRFPDLMENELDNVTVEVTILTVPERITSDPSQLVKDIIIGRDGLMIEHRGRRGLLLPQVPVEWNWNVIEYLQNLSLKAGLREDEWKNSTIYRFEGLIFHEKEPNGEVYNGND